MPNDATATRIVSATTLFLTGRWQLETRALDQHEWEPDQLVTLDHGVTTCPRNNRLAILIAASKTFAPAGVKAGDNCVVIRASDTLLPPMTWLGPPNGNFKIVNIASMNQSCKTIKSHDRVAAVRAIVAVVKPASPLTVMMGFFRCGSTTSSVEISALLFHTRARSDRLMSGAASSHINEYRQARFSNS